MLKYRLLFGTLMILLFVGLIILDAWIDGSITLDQNDDKPVQATIFAILIVAVAFLSVLELAGLIQTKGMIVFVPIVILSSILLATSWYWRQLRPEPIAFHLYYVLFVSAFSLLALFVYQALRFANAGMINNCASSLFVIFYLGFLSSFILGLRIDFGTWALLMFITTIKSSDTGAYTLGRLLGKHKMAPQISPGKTWEGLAGAVIFAIIAALVFSLACDIMTWLQSIIFGAIFGLLGQMGDLAESMIKRDAGKKDSSANIPGFGGVLDIIDSPIATAPAAYLFFKLICN